MTASNADQTDAVTKEGYIRTSTLGWTTSIDSVDWATIPEMKEFNNDLFSLKIFSSTVYPYPSSCNVNRSNDDALTWTSVLDATGYSLVVKGDTLYVPTADGTDGRMYTTTDGTNWNRSNLIFNSL